MAGIKLIADSGATKTEWHIIDGKKRSSFFTAGISPYHMDKGKIEALLNEELSPSIKKISYSSIHYYGTGCYTKANANIVKRALTSVLLSKKVNVTHDLMGAAIALCGKSKGFACILGTGSNSCFFNGSKIVENSPGLGYVLGDEGSGAYLGRMVLQHFLYKQFDQDLMDRFADTYGLTKAEILQKVYKEPYANRFLATFSKFLSQHRGHYIIENIIEDGLRDFFDVHLIRYKNHSSYPFHFVGSISFHFKDKIIELCNYYGLDFGKIIKQPMEGLVDFHK
jgi:glucosamine kinase